MTSVASTGFSSEPFDSWLNYVHWAPSSLTYSFPVNGSFYSYQSLNSVTPLTAAQVDAVKAVLDEISSFTAMEFVEISETFATEATLRFAREVGLDGGYAYLPESDELAGDAFFGNGTDDPVPGNEAYLYFTHEIGHAMGLDHGHEFSAFAGGPFDSQEFTVMTYADFAGDPDIDSYDSGPTSWAQTYMQLDIAAMQFLYGANYASSGEIWSGNTVYRFDPATGEMSINGAGHGAPVGNTIFRTIWDGHGVDTYDLGNYTTDLLIDLQPGAFSTFSTAQLADLNQFDDDPQYLADGNVANARLVGGDTRALIENAKGGAGDDSITGNQADNRLDGGKGNDWLSGLDGADTLIGGGQKDKLEGGGDSDVLMGGGGRDVAKGGSGADRLVGGGGNDKLKGAGGGDTFIGGGGADRMTGGGGRDKFVYKSTSDASIGSKIETIFDFNTRKDVLDFSDLSNNVLKLSIGGSHDGSRNVVTTETGGDTRVTVDSNGDGAADMEILLAGTTGLDAGDFIL